MRRLSLSALIVLASLAAQPAAAADGRKLFLDNCSACHMPNGVGVPGAFPALVGTKLIKGDPKEPISRVLKGKGGMPAFHTELSDLEIAVILTYVRASWGNGARPVQPMQVAALRGVSAKPQPKGALQAH